MPSMPGIITSTIAASNGSDSRQLEPVVAARRQAHVVALARQQRLEDLAHDLFVVDDQDGAVAAHADALCCSVPRRAAVVGRRRAETPAMNRVPWPTALSQSIEPSCSRTMP